MNGFPSTMMSPFHTRTQARIPFFPPSGTGKSLDEPRPLAPHVAANPELTDFRLELHRTLTTDDVALLHNVPKEAKTLLKALLKEAFSDSQVLIWRNEGPLPLNFHELQSFYDLHFDDLKSHHTVVLSSPEVALAEKDPEKFAHFLDQLNDHLDFRDTLSVKVVLLQEAKLPEEAILEVPTVGFPGFYPPMLESLNRGQKLERLADKLHLPRFEKEQLWSLFHGVPTSEISTLLYETSEPRNTEALHRTVHEYFKITDSDSSESLESPSKKARHDPPDEPPLKLSEILQLPPAVKRYVETIEKIDQIKKLKQNVNGWRHILFTGPPGTGKTVTAEAIAYEIGAKFLKPSVGDIKSKWVNEDIVNLKALFNKASDLAQSHEKGVVLFLDELDSYTSDRSEADSSSARNRADAVNFILTKMDDITRNNENIFVIGATNHSHQIDSAFLSRIRKQAAFEPLTPEQTRGLIFNELKKIPQNTIREQDLQSVPLELIKEGRSLHQLIEEAVLEAVNRANGAEPTLELQDLLKAYEWFADQKGEKKGGQLPDHIKHIYV